MESKQINNIFTDTKKTQQTFSDTIIKETYRTTGTS